MDSFEKDALRAQIRQAKRALTPAQIASASAELAAALRRHPLYRQARSLYGYLSYNQEVETHALLLQAQRDGKRVAVPKVTGPGEMVFYWLDELTQVAPGYCGIPEPDGSQPAADDDTALVLTPGLAFDRQGHRMGYGGGFYDRYLAAHPHPTIALCYDFQLLPHLDAAAHDIPVDAVLAAPVPGARSECEARENDNEVTQ